MTDKDSNDLLDVPSAAKLGPHRALLYDEERVGTLEKFRPYDRPPIRWIVEVCEQLRARA